MIYRTPKRLAFLIALAIFGLAGVALKRGGTAMASGEESSASEKTDASITGPGRVLLSDDDKNWFTSEECDTEFEVLGNGALAVIIYITASLYNFLALATVVDGFFVRSIEVILRRLKISEDVAGAIFMAAGTSAAELFSNLIDTFVYRTNIGFGVIYGTVLFNIFVGVGYASYICPSDSKKCDWRVMARDTIWYLFSIVMVVIFIWDQEMQWYESFILVLMYAGYITTVCYQHKLEEWCCDPLGDAADAMLSGRAGKAPKSIKTSDMRHKPLQNAMELEEKSDLDSDRPQSNAPSEHKPEGGGDGDRKIDMSVEKVPPAGDEGGDLDAPTTAFGWIIKCLSYPLEFVFTWTIPDSGTAEEPTGKYMFSFLCACLWIAGLSWLMVKFATSIGCIIGVGPVLLGTVFLALGTSIPDCMSTAIAARKGEGAIAVSNTLGSNIFDMQIAIGLPWFIFSLVEGEPYPLRHGPLAGPIVFLLLSALVLHFGLSMFGWKLRRRLGFILNALYVIFIIYIFSEEFA